MDNFIENLKAGDLVIVQCRAYEKVSKVEKITPSGLIKVNGILFNRNGIERGGDAWSKCYLRKATPQLVQEIREKITIQKAIKLMRNISTITLAQANRIIEILEESEEQKND